MDMWFLRYASEQTNRQTNKHTDTLIAVLCMTTGGEVAAYTDIKIADIMWYLMS